MGCVELRCSVLKYMGELGCQSFKKAYYPVLNIESVVTEIMNMHAVAY